MRTRFRRDGGGQAGDERGAIAALVALLVTVVLVPLVAVSLRSFVRAGTVGELQRAADSGALAGAAAIPLTSISSIAGGIFAGPPQPLELACGQALAAAQTDSQLGEDYTDQDSWDCTAEYIPDPTFADSAFNCLNSLTGPDPVTAYLRSLLEELLPALYQPGVRVTVARAFQPSGLEELAGAAPGEEVRTAEAIRRIKNAVPLVPRLPGLGLSATLAQARSLVLQALGTAATLASVLSPSCGAVFTGLRNEVSDAFNPSGDEVAPEELVADAIAQASGVVGYVLGQDPPGDCPLVCPPLLDVREVCLTGPPSAPRIVSCVAGGRGAFRATLVE